MSSLNKRIPEWHHEAKKLLAEHFAKINYQFLDSTKKAVWLGLFLQDIKARGKSDGSIPHGQFGKWMAENLPDVSLRQAQTYMQLAKDVCEKGKFQIRDFRVFAASGELPPPILKLVEGKTQNQLWLEYKQMELGEDGEFHVKRGRLKGSSGLSKSQRELAAVRSEQERIAVLEEQCGETENWLLENADAKNAGAMESKVLKKLADACDTMSGFIRRTLEARKGQ